MADEAPAQNTELTDEQVTDLYNKIQSPDSNEVKMSAEAEPKTWDLAEGVSSSEEDMVNYAKQGYEHNQNVEAFNKEKADFSGIQDRYKEIDEYAVANPAWFEHVQKSFGERENFNGTAGDIPAETKELSPELQGFQNQINEITQFISGQKAQQDQRVQSEEDNLLDEEINSIKEKYNYMDFTTANDKGQTLEQQVLSHAQDIGTNSFRVAFRDFAYDKLISKAQETGKETIGNEMRKQTKLGILGKVNKSDKPETKQTSVKGKSYEDLLNEAISELDA